MPPPAPASPLWPLLVLLALPAGLLACRSNPASTTPDAPAASPDLAAGSASPNRPIDPKLVPLFSALDEALASDNRPLAKHLLSQLKTQPLGSTERAAVERVELVIDGRELQDSLALEVVSRPISSEGQEREALLLASHGLAEPVNLDLPPGLLIRSHRAISPTGQEFIDADQVQTEQALRLEIPAGERVELVLARYPIQFAGALAIQERLALSTLDGVARQGERSLPLRDLKVKSSERTLLFGELPKQALDERPLLDLLARPGLLERPSEDVLPALLERTVRIAPARRDAALLGLCRFAQGLSDPQLLKITPLLRWLGGVEDEVPSPMRWRSLVAEFIAAGERAAAEPQAREPEPGLLLPAEQKPG
jgi:hypothetical protein